MGLKPWLHSVMSLEICRWAHCTDFAVGPLKITFSGGRSGPQRTSFWVSLNRWALKLSSISWPASSKNMNGLHLLPALAPSKNTCTVGKPNTDNNQIKSNQITFHSPQHKCLGEWNSYERAPDSAKQKTIYIWTVRIEFGGFFFLSQQQASWNWSYLNILSPLLLRFQNVVQNFS